jgi:tetratricopeptide (TPR) repeat protein
MLAANISQACVVKSWVYVLTNGLKVDRYSKNALAFAPDNVDAKYLIAARWVYAPALFNNIKRGLLMMEEIAGEHESVMTKDESFRVYTAIAYSHLELDNYEAAQPWIDKALVLYPANKFAASMLKAVQSASAGGIKGRYKW